MPVIGIRIIDKQYSEDFVNKGIIHFSSPKDWTDKNKASGHQLDVNEGCFCFSTEDNDEALKERGRAFIKMQSDGNYRYFSDSSKVLACCFYGIKKSDFKRWKMKYGVEQIDTLDFKVERSYFDKFNDKDSKEKAVIIVFDLPAFVNRLYEKLIKFGFQASDIQVLPVYYVCKSLPFYCKEPFPFEYFLKDSEFVEQSEFRILINCSNEALLKKFNECDCNVALGDISKYTHVQDFYEDDLHFSIQGNKLIYNLATPIHTHINEMSFEDLVGILMQVQDNKLPQGVLTEEEIDAHMKPIEALLRDKFHVLYLREQRTLINVSEELNRRLEAKYKKS